SFCAFDRADSRFRSTFFTVPARLTARSCRVDSFAARLAASICFAVGFVATVCILFSRFFDAVLSMPNHKAVSLTGSPNLN
ncbi:hypothetical protein ACDV25_002138, partial [Neisseria gonorrhoeae]